ncbi:MAG: tyrosine-type recombinase/integrase [Sphingomonadaceae bacterium]|nr:tyrosine-type recombinase/integrase [Sphingomonadaceae bacterium]
MVWYFRRGKGKRVRLTGAFGSQEFSDSYAAALAGAPQSVKTKNPASSLRWLVNQYLESGRFAKLSGETQKMRRRVLLSVCKTGGDLNFRNITADDVQRGKVRREATPGAAVNYVKIMRALFNFAKDSTWIAENPAENIKATAPRTDGHHTWTVEEVAQYQTKHPTGTQARLALDLMLYTGFRRGDAVMLGKQHVRDGLITYRTGKKGVMVEIPVLPPLAASIAATQTGDLAFLCTSRGQAWTKESFGAWFADQCVAARVPGRAHGLRKAGATIAAENGANEFQLSAMYGWNDTRMALTYTKRANKKRLAKQAANALYPHLESGAGVSANNSIKSKAEK